MKFKAGKAIRAEEFVERLSNDSLTILYNNFINEPIEENKKRQELFKRFASLPNDEIQLINDISTDKGHPHLIKACKKHQVDFDYSELTALDLAVRLFFNYNEAFKSAYNLYNIDAIETFTDYKGMEAKQPDNNQSENMLKEFEAYLKNKGKGNKAVAEIYNYSDKSTYIIRYGDYKKDYKILENGLFINRKQRHAKEITMVYYPKQGKLRLHAHTQDLKKEAVSLFAKYILTDEEFFKNSLKASYYDLAKVFSLTEENQRLNPNEVDSVSMTELTIQNTTKETTQINYRDTDVLRLLREREERIDLFKPIYIKLAFKLKGFGRQNRRTIEISLPNKTNINDSPRDEMIMSYLIKWGIAVVD